MHQENKDRENLEYYEAICPFKEHPCGLDSIFHPVAGFIDPDIFLEYLVAVAPNYRYLHVDFTKMQLT